jgi:hypothetical protein
MKAVPSRTMESRTDRGRWTTRLMALIRDERGTAMTEYLLVSGIMVLVAVWLFDPSNPFFQVFRSQYDTTMTLLQYPGP